MEPLLDSYARVDSQEVAVQAAVFEEVTYLKAIGTGTDLLLNLQSGQAARCALQNEVDNLPPLE